MRWFAIFLLGFLIAFVGEMPAGAQVLAAPKGDASKLVRELADPSFRIREEAQRDLIRMGSAAVAAVKLGSQDDDLEIRRRSRNILREILRSEADNFLEPFLTGKDHAKMLLPGWDAVRGVMGDDETSRRLYSLLYKTDRTFLQTLERNPKAAGEQIEGRWRDLAVKMVHDPKQSRIQDVPTGEIAALLLIATVKRTGLESRSVDVCSCLRQPLFQQSICWHGATRRLTQKYLERLCDDPVVGIQADVLGLARTFGCADIIETTLRTSALRYIESAAANPSDHEGLIRAFSLASNLNFVETIEHTLKPVVRKALVAAQNRPVDPAATSKCLDLAQALRLKEAIPLALKVVCMERAEMYHRVRALAFVAKFGDREAITTLETAVDNDEPIMKTKISDVELSVFFGDVVLGIVVELSGQPLEDYFFPAPGLIKAQPQWEVDMRSHLFFARRFGFESDTTRNAARGKWSEWRRGQNTNPGRNRKANS